jgi:hypothetical protein
VAQRRRRPHSNSLRIFFWKKLKEQKEKKSEKKLTKHNCMLRDP